MLNNVHTLGLLQTYLARAVAVLALVCTVAVFLYGTFLLLAVSHTAARSTAQKQIGTVTAHLGSLEMQYLTLTKELTPQRAADLGFVTPTEAAHATVFASASTRSLSLKQ
ncbi:MAG: hypothetical protein Q7S26_04120 [bacterium]|nr:hypothetical protein [bacterium]